MHSWPIAPADRDGRLQIDSHSPSAACKRAADTSDEGGGWRMH
jgi:hypothetical protein